MLTLDYGIDREIKKVLLGKLRSQLANYFDFMTSGSLGEALAYAQASGRAGNAEELTANSTTQAQVQRRLSVRRDPVMSKIFEIFADSGEGATPGLVSSGNVKSYKQQLEELLNTVVTSDPEYIRKKAKVAECIAIHYMQDNGPPSERVAGIVIPDLQKIGRFENDTDRVSLASRMTAYEVLHPLMQQGEKNAELLTVFFNAMPVLEMTRATPVLNINIFSSRQVEQNGRLGALTLHKFLEGAVEIPTSPSDPLRAINLASQITASIFGEREADFQNFSLVGMELFKAPQTLQNIDATKNRANYLAPVIDPMRPLASIKSLNIEVRPTVGLMSSKTAKLEIVLHDRSRLGEFADFVKPDRYGSSFLEIEYGWNHPDGLNLEGTQEAVANPYAQLLNLIRVKEHYGIATSNFSFDEVGQVNITLNLYTRGTAEISEMSIVSTDPNLRRQLRELHNFSKDVNRLVASINRPRQTTGTDADDSGTTQHRQEVRGNQMLTAATDSENMLLLNDDLFRALRELRTSLGRIGGNDNETARTQRANAQNLESIINRIVGNPTANTNGVNGTPGAQSAVRQVQNSVNNAILQALEQINSNDQGQPTSDNPYDYDIFLSRMPQKVKQHLYRVHERHSGLRTEAQGTAQLAQFDPQAPVRRTAAPRARARR